MKSRKFLVSEELRKFGWDTLVDLGCQGGVLHQTIEKEFPNKKIIGIDISGNPDIKYDLNKGIPLNNRSVDVIFAGEIIEHLNEPHFFLKECKRVLKEDGTLILTTPNARGLNIMQGRYSRDHQYIWTLPMLEKLMKRSGFRLIKRTYTSSWKRNLLFRLVATLFPCFSTTIIVVAKSSKLR